jgi:hypothetical protein
MRKRRSAKARHYKPIPCIGGGHITLSIWPPGSFLESGKYCVMVGGCGCGAAKTLKEAERLLLQRATECLESRILDASRVAQHYQRQRDELKLIRMRKTGG